MYQRVLLVFNPDSHQSRKNADRASDVLSSMGVFSNRIEANSRESLKAFLSNSPDMLEMLRTQSCLLVVLASPGVMLNCISILGDFIEGAAGVYSMDHQSDVLMDFPFHEFMVHLPEVLMGLTPSDERTISIAELHNGIDLSPHQIPFASDLVISNSTLDGDFATSISFGRYGIAKFELNTFAVALPTGTTRYALSLGGPVVSLSLDCWTCVPCGQRPLSLRPFLLPQSEPLEITIHPSHKLFLLVDGQERVSVPPSAKLVIKKHPKPIRFLHPKSWNYFSDLQDLLNWQRLPI